MQQVILHPDFSDVTLTNDVALIGLNRGTTTSPVVLSTLNEYQIPERLAVAGWGRTEIEYLNGDMAVSDALKYAWVPFVNFTTCTNAFNEWNIDPPAPTDICAGGEKSDACEGDSGMLACFMQMCLFGS